MHFDWTIHAYDMVIIGGAVLAVALRDRARINSVPGLSDRLISLESKLDNLTNAVAKLQGSFETYKEVEIGHSRNFR